MSIISSGLYALDNINIVIVSLSTLACYKTALFLYNQLHNLCITYYLCDKSKKYELRLNTLIILITYVYLFI